VTPARRDSSLRVTPEVLAFYIKRAHRLRDEAWRNLWTGVWAAIAAIRLKRIPRSFRDGPKDQTRNLGIPGSRSRAPRND